MDNLDYIESYFTQDQDPESKRQFETRIETDPVFAEDLAFYLSTQQAAKELIQEEKTKRFKELYQQQYPGTKKTEGKLVSFQTDKELAFSVRKIIYYITAAAVVTGIIFGIRFLNSSSSPRELAQQYEKENLTTLGVTMSGHADSIQQGLILYNSGEYQKALSQFERIIGTDSSNFTAKEYAGLSALRLKQYDKALDWFQALGKYTDLYANPAKLYQAIALMDRNQPNDTAKARLLLEQIVQNNEEGKETAQEWLKKW